jgi:hypothetical protein
MSGYFSFDPKLGLVPQAQRAREPLNLVVYGKEE